MFDWGYLLNALVQIVVVTIVVCFLAVIIVNTVRNLRKKDK